MACYAPAEELVYLVSRRFCMRTHIFIPVIEGGFDDRLYRLFVQAAKTPGKMSEAHYRIAAHLIIEYVIAKIETDILCNQPVRAHECNGN